MVPFIERLKKSYGLEIIDCHVHPFDVMGVVHNTDYISENGLLLYKGKNNYEYKKQFNIPTLSEKFHHNNFSQVLIKSLFKIYPSAVANSIKDSYAVSGKKRLLDEMQAAGIDKCVLIPIEPFVSTQSIYKNFNASSFIIMGSIDIQNIPYDAIKENIILQINQYNIKGIKLHPNLQGFHPQPKKNNNELCMKLKILYRVIGECGLYVLFHGGSTNIFNIQKQRGAHTNFASLDNFFTNNDECLEVFNKYNTPVILAHAGSYAQLKLNVGKLKKICYKHPNVFFDTAGLAEKIIRRVIEAVGSKKIIFGSDALYDKMIYKIRFTYNALKGAKISESIETASINIFGNNFKKFVLRKLL